MHPVVTICLSLLAFGLVSTYGLSRAQRPGAQRMWATMALGAIWAVVVVALLAA